MKINIAFILLGLLLLVIGYLILQISIPWIRLEWSPTPISLTTINPFEPIGYILAAFGTIFLIFGFVNNTIFRLIFAIISVICLIAFLKGWISLEWINSLMP